MNKPKHNPISYILLFEIIAIAILFIVPILINLIGVDWNIGIDASWGLVITMLIIITVITFLLWFIVGFVSRLKK